MKVMNGKSETFSQRAGRKTRVRGWEHVLLRKRLHACNQAMQWTKSDKLPTKDLLFRPALQALATRQEDSGVRITSMPIGPLVGVVRVWQQG